MQARARQEHRRRSEEALSWPAATHGEAEPDLGFTSAGEGMLDEDGKELTNQRLSGTNSTRDLVTTVAVVLGKRSDDLLLTHDGVVLGMTDARLAEVFLGRAR